MSFDKADTSEAIKTYQTQSYHKTSIRARDFGKGEEIFTNCLFIRCDKWKVLYLGGNHVLSTTATAAGMDAVSTSASTVLLPTAAIATTSADEAATKEEAYRVDCPGGDCWLARHLLSSRQCCQLC